MKKKRIEALPPIQLRETRKKPYMAVAEVMEISGQRHLLMDVYERERHILRAAYTAHDYGIWWPEKGNWQRRHIGDDYRKYNGSPIWDEFDMIDGPGLPDSAKWSNTGIDSESKTIIKTFLQEAMDLKDRYLPPLYDKYWECLRKLEGVINEERKEKEETSRNTRLKERCEDMPALPEGLKDFADKECFGRREYIYYKRHGRKADCICSKCGGEYTIITQRRDSYEGQFEHISETPRQNAGTTCEMCGTSAFYKAAGRCKYIYGEIQNVYVMQKFRTGTVIRYLNAHKEWGIECKSNIFVKERARIFRIEGKDFVDWNETGYEGERYWDNRNYLGQGHIVLGNGAVFTGNADEWETPELQYSGIREFLEATATFTKPQRYLDAAKQYPMEQLVKLGLFNIVDKIVDGNSLGLNRGVRRTQKIDTVLRIRRCRLSLLQSHDNVEMLNTLQAEHWVTQRALKGKAKGKGAWTEEQIMKAYAMRIDASYENFFRYISISQLINRVEKWIGREIIFLNNATAFGDVSACQKAAYYRDYINMRIEYGYDMERSTSLYPRDLSEAHRAMVLAAKRKDNEAKAAEREKAYPEFKKRFRSLKARYGYKAGDLMIRPAKTILEVMEEGQLLHHCVGASNTYIDRHARGESAILFLRFVSDPNTPYITVEIKDEKIMQWYGRNDTKPDKEVIEKWLSAWIEAITERKKSKEAAKGAALVADQNILQAAV